MSAGQMKTWKALLEMAMADVEVPERNLAWARLEAWLTNASLRETSAMPIELSPRVKAAMVAQGTLNASDLLYIACSLFMGRPVSALEMGTATAGTRPQSLPLLRKAAVAGEPTITTALAETRASGALTGLETHFTDLAGLMNHDGHPFAAKAAALILSFWTKTRDLLHGDPTSMADYFEKYFRQYAGLGLPTEFDMALVFRSMRHHVGGGGSTSGLTAAAAAMKDEMRSLKVELESLKSSHDGPRRAPWVERTCHRCGEAGHMVAECPRGAGSRKKGDELKDE